MKINEEQYRELKREVETAQREADRAKGGLEQLMRQLREEFGCANLQEAKELLVRLKKKQAAAAESYESSLAEYLKTWKA